MLTDNILKSSILNLESSVTVQVEVCACERKWVKSRVTVRYRFLLMESPFNDAEKQVDEQHDVERREVEDEPIDGVQEANEY